MEAAPRHDLEIGGGRRAFVNFLLLILLASYKPPRPPSSFNPITMSGDPIPPQLPDETIPEEPSASASTSTAASASTGSRISKNGSVSKMRSHRGNIPTLPQTKFCPLCPAKFTRTTHLNRHLKTRMSPVVKACTGIILTRLCTPQIPTNGFMNAM